MVLMIMWIVEMMRQVAFVCVVKDRGWRNLEQVFQQLGQVPRPATAKLDEAPAGMEFE